jgi:hypothetical protein
LDKHLPETGTCKPGTEKLQTANRELKTGKPLPFKIPLSTVFLAAILNPKYYRFVLDMNR